MLLIKVGKALHQLNVHIKFTTPLFQIKYGLYSWKLLNGYYGKFNMCLDLFLRTSLGKLNEDFAKVFEPTLSITNNLLYITRTRYYDIRFQIRI